MIHQFAKAQLKLLKNKAVLVIIGGLQTQLVNTSS